MTVQFNHTIVWSSDKKEGAAFLTEMLGLPDAVPFGPFMVVETDNGASIDYHDVESNPRLLIRSIRDELVELVPGAYLGKMLWRHDAERHTLLAYFALREPSG